MFAVLTMEPDMSHGHWLLITLTAGVGGSLLSVGSAAGVALMGQARGNYTFMGTCAGPRSSPWLHRQRGDSPMAQWHSFALHG